MLGKGSPPRKHGGTYSAYVHFGNCVSLPQNCWQGPANCETCLAHCFRNQLWLPKPSANPLIVSSLYQRYNCNHCPPFAYLTPLQLACLSLQERLLSSSHDVPPARPTYHTTPRTAKIRIAQHGMIRCRELRCRPKKCPATLVVALALRRARIHWTALHQLGRYAFRLSE